MKRTKITMLGGQPVANPVLEHISMVNMPHHVVNLEVILVCMCFFATFGVASRRKLTVCIPLALRLTRG